MDAKDFYPSKWLCADDVVDGEEVTIHNVRLDKVRESDRPVLDLKAPKSMLKPFILSRDNNKFLREMFGDQTDQWIGKKVSLKLVPYAYGDKRGTKISLGLVKE